MHQVSHPILMKIKLQSLFQAIVSRDYCYTFINKGIYIYIYVFDLAQSRYTCLFSLCAL